jgi:Leucine-rich repeat (LRR) protein
MKLHKSVLLITGLISAMHASGMQPVQYLRNAQQEILIQLVSSEKTSVFVPRESALQAATLATILNPPQEAGAFQEAQTKSIPLRIIDTATLEIIGQIMHSADRHSQLKGKAFLEAISKEITIADERFISVLNACNFLDYAPGIRLIAMEMINKPAIINHVIKSIQTNQLSDDTAKQIAKIYYLITQKDLEGVDKKPIVTIGFSIRDYLEYLPDVIKKRKTETELDLSGLRLNDTDGLRDIPDLNNLQYLYLHNNQLTELSATLFNGLNNLQVLWLYNNQLTQLPATLFKGLNNLREIYLYDNQLTQLPATLFNGLNNLQVLWLYSNQLTQLPATLFNGLNNLQEVLLSNNQLTELLATLFNGLNNLRVLHLDNNQLTELSAMLFNGLNNLREIYLYDNQLTQLPATLFNGLNNLQILYLHDNQLTQLPATLFNGLNNLRYLSLSNNQLTELPGTLFNGLNNLQYLSLSNNQLTDANKEQIMNALPGVNIF